MSTKFKLLLTISEFMYSSQVRNLCDLVSCLDRDVFDIEIGALAVGDEATGEIEALGVPFYQLRVHPPQKPSPRRWGQFFVSPAIVAKKRFDIVHSLLYQCLFTESLIMKVFSGAKYVYTKSNNQWENHPLNWRLKSRLSDKIISISRSTDEVLIANGFGDKIERIYLGIDTARFRESPEKRNRVRAAESIPPEALVFGCAAQFVEWKEHLTLVAAFERLGAAHRDIHLFFCGPNHADDYFRQFSKRVAESPARERIHVLGTLEDMPAFYSAIDCFVLPSRVEPFGYVYIEAMSCNKPVIACRAGGPLDIIREGRDGFFVNISDASDLADKMALYIADKSRMCDHGNSARRRVEDEFSKEIMARNHQALYLRMLEGK